MKHTDLTNILTEVSKAYRIPVEILKSPGVRTPAVARARHIAIYLACKQTWLSKDNIAKFFNQRDHSATFYAFNKISMLLGKDAGLKTELDDLAKKLTPK